MIYVTLEFIGKISKQINRVHFHHSAHDISDDLGVFPFILKDPWIPVVLLFVSTLFVEFLQFTGCVWAFDCMMGHVFLLAVLGGREKASHFIKTSLFPKNVFVQFEVYKSFGDIDVFEGHLGFLNEPSDSSGC